MIIAVDFDGILFEDEFPGIGRPNYEVIMFVRQLIDEGHEVILWTSRTGGRLDEAVEMCDDYGLRFCAINENAPSNLAQYISVYPNPSPKVYADLYLDDRDPWFFRYMQCNGHDRSLALQTLIDHTRKTINYFKGNKKYTVDDRLRRMSEEDHDD